MAARPSPKPPPMLMGCRVIRYAVRDRSIRFRGRTGLFVDGNELGSVPRLAIGESRAGELVLFHCGRTWNVRGTDGFYKELAEVQRLAERTYPGISKKWVRPGISKRQAEAYRKKLWKGMECSFCRRLPDEFQGMVEKDRVRICDICVRQMVELLKPEATNSVN